MEDASCLFSLSPLKEANPRVLGRPSQKFDPQGFKGLPKCNHRPDMS